MQGKENTPSLKYSLLGMLVHSYLTVKGQNKPVVREKVKVE